MRREGASFGDIAREFSLTRNQVAGMVRDLRKSGVVMPSDPLASLPGTILDTHYGGDEPRE